MEHQTKEVKISTTVYSN